MSDDNATNVVDGSGYTDRMKEIAKNNNIQLAEDVNEGEVSKDEAIQEDQPKEQEDVKSAAESDESAGLESNSSPEDSTKEDELEELPKGFKKRLGREKKKRKQLEETMNSKIAEMQATIEQLQNAGKSKGSREVGRENFRTDAEYIQHLAKQEAKKMFDEQVAQAQEHQEHQQKYQSMEKSWNDKVNENFDESELSDYHAAIQELGNPANLFGKDVTEYIFKHKNGPRILKHFADNPEAVDEFNNMHDWDKVSYLREALKPSQPETVKKVSRAPTPVGNLSSQGSPKKSVNEMSTQEQMKFYRDNPAAWHSSRKT